MKDIEDIIESLKIVWELVMTGAADLSQRLSFISGDGRTKAQVYFAGLRRLAFMAVIIPLPFLILGVAKDSTWIVASAGIWCAMFLSLIAIVSSPLGILIEAITGGIKGSAARYIGVIKNILYAELAVILLVAVLPIRNNLAAIPVIIVAAAVLLLKGNTDMFKKVVMNVARAALIILTLAFIFTWIPSAMKKGVHKVNVTAENIISGVEGSQPGQRSLTQIMAAEDPIKVYHIKDMPKEGIDVYKNASVAVVLPLGVWAQTDPDVDVAVYFPDAGKLVIDGPNKNPVYGDSAEYKILRVRALEKEGKFKLTPQKKKTV